MSIVVSGSKSSRGADEEGRDRPNESLTELIQEKMSNLFGDGDSGSKIESGDESSEKWRSTTDPGESQLKGGCISPA